MKKKQMLATLVMLSLLQGSVYAENITAETQDEYNAVAANDSLILTGDNNTVNIGAEGANITGDVITSGSGSSNTLTITDSNFNNVYGANGGENAVGNTVTINGNSVIGIETEEDEDKGYNYSVIGGQAAANGQASQNNVVINGGTFEGTVVGGLINLDDKNGTGSATNNKVIINGGIFNLSNLDGTSTTSVEGAHAINGEASYNEVNIYGGTFNEHIRGGISEKNNANYNIVIVGTLDDKDGNNKNINIDASIYGGYSSSEYSNGNANFNKVIIHGGVIDEGVSGGLAIKNSAQYNTVIVDGGKLDGQVTGGGANYGSASYNKVTVSGNAEIEKDVIGGSTIDGIASNNVVWIKDDVRVKGVNGGENIVGEADVVQNTVNISGGTIDGLVAGGYINIAHSTSDSNEKIGGDTIANTVNIFGGTINNTVYGGFGDGEKVTFNTVNISKGTITGEVYGGWNKYDGIVTENTVKITGGVVESTVYGGRNLGDNEVRDNIVEIAGGHVESDIFGGYSSDGVVINNQINITEESIVDGVIYGAYSNNGEVKDNIVVVSGGEVKNNIVAVSGGEVDGTVYGGYGRDGEVTSNNVNISGGDIYSSVYGGKTTNGKASGNSVTISDGVANANVYGGYSSDGEVKDNIVSISGGDVNGDIYVACSDSGQTINNALVLSGTADVTGSNLYGTNKIGQTDNKLVIDAWTGATKKVDKFNLIEFTNTQWETNGVILDITKGSNNALEDTHINLNDMTVAGGVKLAVGDKMTFIQSNVDTGLDMENVEEKAAFTQGVATVGEGEVQLEGKTNNLVYKVTEVKRNEQTDLVAEGRVASAAFINHGTDLIAYALDTLGRDDTYGIKTFAAVQGERTKYDVSNDIKINGWNTLVGVGNENEHNDGDFSWGVFYENGSANYRTYNNFNNEFFRGDGSLVYNGGGIAARYENEHGVYTEGSLRAGMLKSEMNNALRDGNGNNYGFKSESAYYGAHIGVGQIMPISEDNELDIYGKFFHTYTEGDSFDVGGDDFEFDGVTSDRLRLGARVTTNKDNSCNTYYGLAYEYEFSGDAVMRVAGMSAPEQSLQGSSCFAEIGLNYRETPDSPWNLDMNVRGYTGERQGVSFYAQATYTF